MVQDDIYVEVPYGDGMAEILSKTMMWEGKEKNHSNIHATDDQHMETG